MLRALLAATVLGVLVAVQTAMATTQTFWRSKVDGLGFRTDPASLITHALYAQVALHRQTIAKAISYALSADKDWCVLFTSGAGGVTATLPTAVGIAGCDFVLKKVDAGAGVVTVATTSAQTIDGGAAAAQNLTAQWQLLRVVSDGANWLKLN